MVDKLVLHDESTNKHYPAPDGFVPDVLSKEEGNYLRLGNDKGIFADGNDILSNQADNALGISAVDGKIYYKGTNGGTGGGGAVDTVSVNDQIPVYPDVNGNVELQGIVTSIKFDSGAVTFLPDLTGLVELPDYPALDLTEVVSTDTCNLLEIDSNDELIVLANNFISTDANNLIALGSDCRLHAAAAGINPGDYVHSDTCNLITVRDGKFISLADNMVSADADNSLVVGSDCKLYVAPVTIPVATTTDYGVVKYDGTTIIENSSEQLAVNIDERTINFNLEGKLGVVQYNMLQDFGDTNTAILDLSTRTSVVVTPSANLTVAIDQLDQNIDKLTTIVIKPTAAVTVTWTFTNPVIWMTETVVEDIAAGEVGIVNVWQQAGGCLLATVYTGAYNN